MPLFRSLVIEEVKKNDRQSVFFFKHLENNLGITLGNSLRRILLDYIPGTALCAIRISDKNALLETKFSIVVGLNKTVFHLISVLKELIFEEKKELPEELVVGFFLQVNNDQDKERILLARDFLPSTNTEEFLKIKNETLELATMAPFSSLKLEIFCRKNIGYVPKKKQETFFFPEKDEKGIIILDTNYSPVVNVFFKEEKVIIGLIEEEEKLTLDLETNGSISPSAVLKKSFEIASLLFENLNKKL